MPIAEIDLSIIIDNIIKIRNVIKTKYCAVLKANAYGHGAVDVAKAIENYVDEFAVATFDEARVLKINGIIKPINILSCYNVPIYTENLDNSISMSNIIPTICDKNEIKFFDKSIESVNIKFNSGMNRLGCNEIELENIIKELDKNYIKIKAIFTHFYKGEDKDLAEIQYNKFNEQIKKYSNLNINFHCCASSCLKLDKKYHMDMVRCGIAMYGYSEITKSAMTVYTTINQIMTVKKGEHIGYGDYLAEKDMTIAAIRVGYADGYRRIINKERYVSINNCLCKVVGQICMDITMVDVSQFKLTGKERVYLLGGAVSGEMLANSFETIIYEVLTSFGRRLKRVYVG